MRRAVPVEEMARGGAQVAMAQDVFRILVRSSAISLACLDREEAVVLCLPDHNLCRAHRVAEMVVPHAETVADKVGSLDRKSVV